MERALFIKDLPEHPLDAVSRIYWGAEFCCWRMPVAARTLQALTWGRRQGLAFSLVTPVLVESFLDRLSDLLKQLLPEFGPDDEVVVSDLGTVSLVRELSSSVPVILGRALSGQKRGPQILELSLTPDQTDYFRQGCWYSRPARELLAEQGISRVELDNLLQGVAPLPTGLHGSLHLPYAMVTSSRNCPFRGPFTGPCRPVCGEVFRLEGKANPVPLFQAGNSQFLENPTPPDDLATLGIDRLVVHDSLPA